MKTIQATRRKSKQPAEASVASEILAAMQDLKESLERGDVLERFTCLQIKLDLEPTPYGPELVKKTRQQLQVSQALFAKFLGVSVKTVKAWEQGLAEPNAMACRFMDEIRLSPAHWTERLRSMIVPIHRPAMVR